MHQQSKDAMLLWRAVACTGWLIFKHNDPWHFGTLGRSMVTLFRATTMDDWSDIYYINSFGCDSPNFDAGTYFSGTMADPPVPSDKLVANRTGIKWSDGCKVSCFNNDVPLLMPKGSFTDSITSEHFGVGIAPHAPAPTWAALLYWSSFVFIASIFLLIGMKPFHLIWEM